MRRSISFGYLFMSFLCIGLLAAFSVKQQGGLDAPEPIGPYLNNAFPEAPTEATPPPRLLSETGAFANLETLEPAQGLLPYALNEPFWSDGALKWRWISIPNDGVHDTAEEQVVFSEEGIWRFPEGTVAVKHFEMVVDQTAPDMTRRLETRFIVKGPADTFYFLTYKWNEAGTDAVLLDNGEIETLVIRTSSGARFQPWTFPSNDECMDCHRSVSGFMLGPSTRQLNGDLTYAKTGRTANQVMTWNSLGIFSTPVYEDSLQHYVTASSSTDSNASLEERALSYLDSNCGYCHRPGSIRTSYFDARLTTPLESSGILNGFAFNNQSLVNGKIVTPGDTALSLIHFRMRNLNNKAAMPPLAKAVIDSAGLKLIGDWILSLGETPTHIETQDPESTDLIASIYPNPFASQATITYTASEAARVHIHLFDAQGRNVRTLFEGVPAPGKHEIVLDGSNLRSGTYFVHIIQGAQKTVHSVVLIST